MVDKTFNGEEVNEIRSLKLGAKKYVFHTVQAPLERQNGKVTSISGIVRDFNNMLGVMIGNASLAREKLDRMDPLYDILNLSR